MYEPIRDPRWLTEVGAADSAAETIQMISAALENPESFLDLVRPWRRSRPWPNSPLQLSVLEGMTTVGLAATDSEKDTEEVRILLREERYSAEEMAAAAALSFEKISAAALLCPEEFGLRAEGFDLIASRARMTAGDIDPDLFLPLERHPAIFEAVQSFQVFCTPEGRVEAIVRPAGEIIRGRRDLLPEILGRIEAGSGNWGKPEPSPYSQAVALGLRKLLGL